MNILTSALLGLVQGLTEFLPISSSGHLVLIQQIFGLDIEGGYKFFDLLLHLGTLAAVFAAFWSDICELVAEFFRWVKDGFKIKGIAERRFIIMVIISVLPLFIAAVFNDYLDSLFENPRVVGIGLVCTAGLLYVCDRIKYGKTTAADAPIWNGLAVGAAQCAAVIPGLSRSGTTITAGVLCGFKREFAVKFAFIMSIPAIVGANILEISDAAGGIVDLSVLPMYITGMAVAAVSGYFAIKLIKYLSTKSGFKWFEVYCLTVGIITLLAAK